MDAREWKLLESFNVDSVGPISVRFDALPAIHLQYKQLPDLESWHETSLLRGLPY